MHVYFGSILPSTDSRCEDYSQHMLCNVEVEFSIYIDLVVIINSCVIIIITPD